MPRDPERLDLLKTAMQEAGLDALVCTLPANVLMLTGYFPVIGTSVALITRDCRVTLLVPEDEKDLADIDSADIVTFRPGSLDFLTTAAHAVAEPLRQVLTDQRLDRAEIGYESGAGVEPVPYVSMHLYNGALPALLAPARLRPASDLLARMQAVLTVIEVDRVRRACRIAEAAFAQGVDSVRAGARETEIAAAFSTPLSVIGTGFEGIFTAGGAVFCMSGPNSANASAAYARSHARELEITDFALVHCNSHAEGYWTDITRTYAIGPISDRQHKLYEAIFEARAAALDLIRPGVRACDVDHAAREVLASHGLAEQFRHSTGHGVGFAAISGNAQPRIHPKSPDRLERGMVFNVEPGVYFDGYGGLRHCDMVAVTQEGVELLTPFHAGLDDLIR